MGFLQKWRVRKLVSAATNLVALGKVDEAFAQLRERERQLGAEPWIQFSSEMLDAGELSIAKRALDTALQSAPDSWNALILSADLHERTGDLDAAIAIYRRLTEMDRKHYGVAVALAEHLFEREDFGGVIATLERFPEHRDRRVAFHLGRAYVLSERADDAAALLGGVVEELESELRHAMTRDDWNALKEELDEAMRWHEEAVSTAHGREEYINVAASLRMLDANAGVNYRLLGQRLMVTSPRIAEHLELRSVAEDEEEGRQLLKRNKKDARALCLLGMSELRQGRLAPARSYFEKACAADGKNFAAFVGLGAALDAARFRLFKKAESLPSLELFDQIETVVPDWRHLTSLERAVVVASVHPLRGALGRLAGSGAVLRILPLDVRATDLPEHDAVRGVREEDDHRAYDAITGLATEHHAITKIEDLVDVDSENGWVLAHELAHMVFFHFESELGDAVKALLERACAAGYVGDEYQRKNIDEFFAVSYTDFLRHQYGMSQQKQLDEGGVMQAIFSLFGSLAQHADFEAVPPAILSRVERSPRTEPFPSEVDGE